MNDDKCQFCKGAGQEPGESSCEWCLGTGTKEGQKLMTPPAEQYRGYLVGYCRAENIARLKKGDLSGFMVEDEPSATVNTPLYTRLAADPGEVERLTEQLEVANQAIAYAAQQSQEKQKVTDALMADAKQFRAERDTLRAQLAEAHALLADAQLSVYSDCGDAENPERAKYAVELAERIDAALSASAEPSAPKCSACNDTGVIDDKEKDELPSGHYVERGLVACKQCEEPSAPVERDEREAMHCSCGACPGGCVAQAALERKP